MIDLATVYKAWKACSWGNSKETAEDWLATLLGSDEASKRRLFGKLFMELSDTEPIHELFDRDSIRTYLSTFDRPLARSHVEKRRKVWRYLYCGIREPVPELDWVIGPKGGL